MVNVLQGLDALSTWNCTGNLARPRKFEIAAAINRLRSVKLEQVVAVKKEEAVPKGPGQ